MFHNFYSMMVLRFGWKTRWALHWQSTNRFISSTVPSGRTSLIKETLETMIVDDPVYTDLKAFGQRKLTLDERKKRRRAIDPLAVPSFKEFMVSKNCILTRKPATIFQLNIGLYCNQACNHCHVESSPKRTEKMSFEIADRCLELIKKSPSVKTIDLTGGAPELNPTFRYLVKESRKLGLEIIDRCNLTVIMEPGQEDLVDFLAENNVRIVASLPCYSEKNVNMQRGQGVFGRSIKGLQLLNDIGYGKKDSSLVLDLVFNPLLGALPPDQKKLEVTYKEKLLADFNIEFNSLFTLTNMPIKRFADLLHRRNELKSYMQLLVANFNPSAVSGLMCRDTISVGWDGSLYDCDFNQQLAIPLGEELLSIEGTPYTPINDNRKTVFDVNSLGELHDKNIAVDLHCFGCTAGSGSSCQGQTTII